MKNNPNPSFVNAIIESIENIVSRMVYTALPGKITKIVDENKGKVNVIPLLKEKINDTEVELPEIKNVNLMGFGNDEFTISYKAKVDQEVLLIFCKNDITNWRLEGKSTVPQDPRQFDISDAIAIPGLYNFKSGNDLLDFSKYGIITQKGSVIIDENGKVDINDGNLTVEP